jgi:hypothetical protein
LSGKSLFKNIEATKKSIDAIMKVMENYNYSTKSYSDLKNSKNHGTTKDSINDLDIKKKGNKSEKRVKK